MMKVRMGRDSDDPNTPLDKTQVLQEAKERFMATSCSTKKLVDVLTKCIFILLRGERLTSTEATDLFFHITRLFQYKDKDSTLRRLTYIGIKALSQQAENVYVVTSSLTNDVNSARNDSAGSALKASALRTLCHISDASTFTSIERYLKQSVVDRHPEVASAALSSLVRITSSNQRSLNNYDIVKRCTNEVQEALNSDSPMVQYHALALRYNSCQNDRLAISRLIQTCTRRGLKSPLATCLLIRIINNFLVDFQPENSKEYISYIKDKLSHPNDMVKYEAANALVGLPRKVEFVEVSRKRLTNVLGEFLSSSRPALKFGAVRTLNKLADYAPSEVREISIDLDTLISQADCNRSIAILAITTLLKIGTENSVEKFLKQIGEFLSEIDEEFKVIVVGSVRQLCSRYPSKHGAMMDFLQSMLREEGGYTYKKAIVDTIINMILDNDQTKDKGLESLCDFIEDCEHINLAVEVIHFLGTEGPKMKKAQTYTRYIANRPLLDPTPVACAAISALAKFGSIPELRQSIKVALDRFSQHEDYEVMERARFYRGILNLEDENLKYSFLNPKIDISLSDLEVKLMNYIESDCSRPFNMSTVARADQVPSLRATEAYIRDEELEENKDAKAGTKRSETEKKEIQAAVPLNVFEEFSLGNLIKSTKPASLTDSVSEFGVQCIKHLYQKHIVFQFNCTNTVDNMCLENVSIEMSPPDGFEVLAATVYPKLAFEDTVPIYVCVELTDDGAYTAMDYFTNVNLKYNFRTIDPETKEPNMDEDASEDLFPLEDMLIDMAELIPADTLDALEDEPEDELM